MRMNTLTNTVSTLELENRLKSYRVLTPQLKTGEDCVTCRPKITSEADVKDVEIPEWKKKALATNADPQAAPFGMSWNTEASISATEASMRVAVAGENENKALAHTCGHNHTTRAPKPVNYSLVLSILIGDGFHNFCDGIFVGVAFLLCSSATAFTIVGITLYHEIAQELADFFLLTRHAGLPVMTALIVNFCAGLAVVLGGVLVLAMEISNLAIGVILAFAAGVYLYIAASECVPRVSAVVQTNMDRLLSVFTFIIGTIPIGLALLKHSHCEV